MKPFLLRLPRPCVFSIQRSILVTPFNSYKSAVTAPSKHNPLFRDQQPIRRMTMGKTVTVYRGTKDGVIHSEQNKVTLEPNDVFVEITHSGVCGADELFLKSGIVLGHEGIGIIRQIGENVTTVKIGDRVGFSFVQKVCGSCHNCLSGM